MKNWLLLCSLISIAFIGFLLACENQKNDWRKPLTERADSTDFLNAFNLVSWAADQFDKKKSIDSLKPHLKEIENLWLERGDSLSWSVYSHTLFELGLGYQMLAQQDSSYTYLKKCYDACMAQMGEKYLLTTMCLNKMAFYFASMGDIKKYRAYLFKSFELRREILDSNDIFLAYAYSNMGGFYDEIGDYSKGKLYNDKYREIIRNQFRIYEQTKDPLKNDRLIKLHGPMVELPNAITYHLTSVPFRYIGVLLSEALGAAIRKEFGLADYSLAEAEAVISRYPREKQRIKDFFFKAKAELAMQKKDYQLADEYLDTLINIHQIANSKGDLFMDYNQKSYVLSRQGRIPEAIQLVENKLIPPSRNVPAHYLRLMRLCQLYTETDNYDKTLDLCDSAFQYFLNKKNYTDLASNQLTWSELVPEDIRRVVYFLFIEIETRIEKLGKVDNKMERDAILIRFDLFNKGLVYLQERNFSEEGKIAQEIVYYPLYEKAMYLATQKFKSDGNEKIVETLLNWSESHKSIALKNSIFQKPALNDYQFLSPVVQVRELQNAIERVKVKILETRGSSTPEDSVRLRNFKSSLFELTADLELTKGKNIDLLQTVYNPNERMNFPMEKLLEYLKTQDAQLIDYFIGDEYLHASLISEHGKSSFSMKLSLAEKAAIDSFILLVKQKDPAKELSSRSNSIYRLIFEPFQEKLASKHLIIIPDGILFKLPFELLENEKGEQLVKNHTIHYEFSSKLILQKANRSAKETYIGFAPEYDGNELIKVTEEKARALEDFYSESRSVLGALHFNIPEVKEGAKIMNGNSYTGTEVNKQIFRNKSRDARIVHLAMHAITDDHNPDYSQLIFKSGPSNEPLFAFELNGYEMNSELAILSACNTGVGKYLRGDGVQSLARSFKSAGCKNILMSLWPANDASTKEIVVGFLANLKSGMGKADALRKAKLDYLAAATPDTRLPYYWAGLVLFGDNEAMSFSKSWLGIVSTVALILLLSLAWLAVRRKIRKKIPVI